MQGAGEAGGWSKILTFRVASLPRWHTGAALVLVQSGRGQAQAYAGQRPVHPLDIDQRVIMHVGLGQDPCVRVPQESRERRAVIQLATGGSEAVGQG